MSDARKTPPSFDEMVGLIKKLFTDYLQDIRPKMVTPEEIDKAWERYKTLNHLYQDEITVNAKSANIAITMPGLPSLSEPILTDEDVKQWEEAVFQDGYSAGIEAEKKRKQCGPVWVKGRLPGSPGDFYCKCKIDGQPKNLIVEFDKNGRWGEAPGFDSYEDFEITEWLDEAAPSNEISQDAHEKEVMMQAFDKVRQIFEGHSWIMDGRGSYPYNDDHYKEEVRYMYDEFDQVFKDTWGNIKSKSVEYRKAIIDEYVNYRLEGIAAEREEDAVNPVKFHKWLIENHWEEHSSGRYWHRSKDRHQWPPEETCEESELVTKFKQRKEKP